MTTLPQAFRTPLCPHGMESWAEVTQTLRNPRTGVTYGALGYCRECKVSAGLRKVVFGEPLPGRES